MKILKFNAVFLLAFLSILFLVSCEKESIQPDQVADSTEIDFDITEQLGEIEWFEEGNSSESARTRGGKLSIRYRTLSKALKCTGLDEAVAAGGLTIYGPTDAAFRKLGLNSKNICSTFSRDELTAILLYHVAGERTRYPVPGCVETLNGSPAHVTSKKRGFFPRYYINDARIFGKFVGGVNDFFIIDEVLIPPANNIVEIAQGAPDFSILVDAVLKANPSILATLTDEDATYTVFAPDNDAFIELLGVLGVGSLEELVSAVGMDGLSTVLAYHVVAGCIFSNDLEDGLRATTLQGEEIEVDLTNLSLIDKTSDAKGLGPLLDVRASNGVIHQIDGVLLPQEVIDLLN
ncbi:MAG: fasciclin domain-containing protein [Saprospiraceae bacterium]|nr:fasciclin domain-containing protein [Saprospiraceae bacterium]